MLKLLWVVTAVAAAFGAFVFVTSTMAANGAPQEAAGAAMAVALAVIPYIFTRCMQELSGR